MVGEGEIVFSVLEKEDHKSIERVSIDDKHKKFDRVGCL